VAPLASKRGRPSLNTKGLPTFGNGVEAPRLVVFKVINLKPLKGKSVEQITRGECGRVVVRVGVDLAKRVIQVHAVDAAGRLITGRALSRDRFIA